MKDGFREEENKSRVGALACVLYGPNANKADDKKTETFRLDLKEGFFLYAESNKSVCLSLSDVTLLARPYHVKERFNVCSRGGINSWSKITAPPRRRPNQHDITIISAAQAYLVDVAVFIRLVNGVELKQIYESHIFGCISK